MPPECQPRGTDPMAVQPPLADILPIFLAYCRSWRPATEFRPDGGVLMLRNVAVVLVNGFLPFEFGTICEVFGVDRSDDGLPCYDFAVVGGEPSPLRTLDFTVQASHGLERLEEADLI